jgi:hypothetical protein
MRLCLRGDPAGTTVDFELALKGLERGKLVGTGPMKPYDNTPGSMFVVEERSLSSILRSN